MEAQVATTPLSFWNLSCSAYRLLWRNLRMILPLACFNILASYLVMAGHFFVEFHIVNERVAQLFTGLVVMCVGVYCYNAVLYRTYTCLFGFERTNWEVLKLAARRFTTVLGVAVMLLLFAAALYISTVLILALIVAGPAELGTGKGLAAFYGHVFWAMHIDAILLFLLLCLLQFAMPLALIEKRSVWQSITASARLAWRHWWRVALLVMVNLGLWYLLYNHAFSPLAAKAAGLPYQSVEAKVFTPLRLIHLVFDLLITMLYAVLVILMLNDLKLRGGASHNRPGVETHGSAPASHSSEPGH